MDLHWMEEQEGTRRRDVKLVAFDLRRKGTGEIRNIISGDSRLTSKIIVP